MITLFYTPHACSLSPHIALREADVPFNLERVDLRGKKTENGRSFTEVNPKGYVPALVLDNGELLTEGAAMVQYIADLKPELQLAPAPGTFERVRLQEWLNFIATELHKGLSPLYSPLPSDEYKTFVKERLTARFSVLAKRLEGESFLLGNRFTVADGYAFYVLRTWQALTKTDLSAPLLAYRDRIAARPAVKAALQAEGI